jgi:hypothetical protein
VPLHTAVIPRVLVDHAYQLILGALTPHVYLGGPQLHVEVGAELKQYFNDVPEAAALAKDHVVDLRGLQGSGRLNVFALDASTGGELLNAMFTRWQELDGE